MKANADAVKSSSPRKVALIVGSDEAVAGIVLKVLAGWKVVRATRTVLLSSCCARSPMISCSRAMKLQAKKTSSCYGRSVLPSAYADDHPDETRYAGRRDRGHSRTSIQLLFRAISGSPTSPRCCNWRLPVGVRQGVEVLSATQTWIRLLARCDLRTANRLLQFTYEIADLPEQGEIRRRYCFPQLLINAIETDRTSTRASTSRSRICERSCCGLQGQGSCGRAFPLRNFATQPSQILLVTPSFIWKSETNRDCAPGASNSRCMLVDEVIYGEAGNDVILIKYLDRWDHSPEQPDPQAEKSNVPDTGH